MRRYLAVITIAVLLIGGCSTHGPSGTAQRPPPTDAVADANQPITPYEPEAGAPAGPYPITPQEALRIARPNGGEGTWDVVFVSQFDPGTLADPGDPAAGRDGGRERPTWIVQRLHPGPNETYYVDAVTGELYATRRSESSAPVYAVKTPEEAAVIVAEAHDPTAGVEGWDDWHVRLIYEDRSPVWVVEFRRRDGEGLAVYLDARVHPPEVLDVRNVRP